jgi:hypothetical protein
MELTVGELQQLLTRDEETACVDRFLARVLPSLDSWSTETLTSEQAIEMMAEVLAASRGTPDSKQQV